MTRPPELIDDLTVRPGYPLRGLSWGVVAAVVAVLVLFAGVLIVESRDRASAGTPGAGPTAPPAAPTGPTAVPTATPTGGRPPAAGGAVLVRGALTGEWESDGWSWDAAVQPGRVGPGSVRAVAVTYRKPWGGYAFRRQAVLRPGPEAVVRVRAYLVGEPVRLGLQLQSADRGGDGPTAVVDVPSGQWATLSVPVSRLHPPNGVRRISLIGQNVPAGTALWVSDVTIG